MRKNARRIQLQQWLLLAVRTLLIVLVVLAVAKPYANEAGIGGSAVCRRIGWWWSIRRFRWLTATQTKTRLARAKELAATITCTTAVPRTTVTVLTLADPPRRLAGRLPRGTDAGPRESDRDARPRRRGASSRRSSRSASSNGHEVYFITDLQRSTWESASDDRIRAVGRTGIAFGVDVGKPDTRQSGGD